MPDESPRLTPPHPFGRPEPHHGANPASLTDHRTGSDDPPAPPPNDAPLRDLLNHALHLSVPHESPAARSAIIDQAECHPAIRAQGGLAQRLHQHNVSLLEASWELVKSIHNKTSPPEEP